MNQEQQIRIYQPNTTQIPNVVLDYWMGILPNAELKCLLAISRKTFGWQKQKDKITKRQIGQASGLSNDAVRKAIRELEKRGLILCTENPCVWGNNDPNTYEVNVIVLNQTEEKCREGGLEITPRGSDFDAQGGAHSSPRGGVISRPTKQNITKPTITKGNAPNPQIEIQTSCIKEQALPFYSSEDQEQTSCQQIFAKPETLTEDQAAISAWLAFQKIPHASSEILDHWAVLYSVEKITSAIDALQNEIAKNKLPASDQINFIQNFLEEKCIYENNTSPVMPSKQSTRIKALNKEQTELYMLIKNQNIEGATDDTITFWACKYQPAKIQSTLQAIQNEIRKGTKFKKSQAAFFRSCLDGKIIPCDNTIQHNKEFAKKFADNKKWRSLKIFEKYVKEDILGDDLNLYMPHDQFATALARLYEKSKLYG